MTPLTLNPTEISILYAMVLLHKSEQTAQVALNKKY
jgi:hypothetical protein